MSEEVHLTDVEATADTPEDEMVAAYRHDTLTSSRVTPRVRAQNVCWRLGEPAGAVRRGRRCGSTEPPQWPTRADGRYPRNPLPTVAVDRREQVRPHRVHTRADVEGTMRRLNTKDDPDTIHYMAR